MEQGRFAVSDKQHSEGFDLAAIWAILRRQMVLIVLAVVVTAGAAVGLSSREEKKYEATAELLFRDPALDQKLFGSSLSGPPQDPVRQAETNLRLVSVRGVAERAARRLDNRLTADQVEAQVKTSSEGKSDVANITATDNDPEEAARLANAFALEFIALRRDADRAKIRGAQRVVQRQLDRLATSGDRDQVRTLRRRAEDLRILASLQTGNAELVQAARTPSSPASPKPMRNGVIGAFIGLLVGLGLALGREQLDRRIKRPEELEQVFGLPLLATVPRSRSLERQTDGVPGLPPFEGEAFRMLRANVRYFNVDREIRSVLVTSAAPKDGKSTVALHLAMAAAESGSRCLLVEADLRAPTLGKQLGIPTDKGLAALLSDPDEQLSEVGWRVPVAPSRNGGPAHPEAPGASLDVVFAGGATPNPPEMLESARMRELLEEAEQRYSLVVIDAPPVTTVSDAIPLLSQVSGVIVICRLGANTRALAERLRDQLRNLSAPTLGVVANFATEQAHPYYAYPYGRAESSRSARTRTFG
jgi:Mrp family chromosome partitioning ATPase